MSDTFYEGSFRAETVLMQTIAQNKDENLLMTTRPAWLITREYKDLLKLWKLKKECMENYLFCLRYVQENSIDISITTLDTVFKIPIKEDVKEAMHILEDMYLRRKVVKIARDMMEGIVLKNPAAVAVEAYTELLMIRFSEEKYKKLGDSIDDEKIDILDLGMEELEDLCIGRQEVLTIGGDSGNHKTNFCLKILIEALKHNYVEKNNTSFTVQFFSKEMNWRQVKNRIISNLFSIPFKKVRYGQFNKPEILKQYKEHFGYFDDHFILHGPEEFNNAEDLAKLITRHCSAIWAVDYLQLLALSQSGDSDSQNSNTIRFMSQIKQLIVATDSLAIPLSQLKKFTDQRISKIPRIEDLEWSGMIKQLSSWIVLLYWPWYYNRATSKEPFFALVEKNRFEEPYKIGYTVKPEFSQFLKSPNPGSLAQFLK